MGVIIGCTAYEAWMAHYDLIGRSHVLRLANGRVFYDEIMLSRSRILITRTKAERGDVVTVDRYIQPDTPVELVPMEPRKSAPAAIRVPSVAVEVPVTNGSQTRQDTPKSSATGKQVTLTNPPIEGAKFRQIEIAGKLTLVPVGGSIANAMPKQVEVVDVKADPHEEAVNQRRAEYRQRRERGKAVNTVTPEVIKLPAYFGSGNGNYLAEARAEYQAKIDASTPAPKPHSYDGRYYGSFSYYSRNR